MKQMENDLKNKQLQITEIETEISGSKNVTKNQEKALNSLKNEGPTNKYLDSMKNLLFKHKNELK